MPLTQRESFKTAFLLRCADEGLTLEETHAAVKEARVRLAPQKQAATAATGLAASVPGLGLLAGAGQGLAKGVTSTLAGHAINLGLLTAIGAPLVIGAAGGLGAANLHNINDQNPDEIKLEETKAALRRATLRARMQAASRQRREKRRPSRPML